MKEIYNGKVFQIGDEIIEKEITLFEVRGKVFEVSDGPKVEEKKTIQTTVLKPQLPKEPLFLDKGNIIGYQKRTPIYENVLKAIHKGLQQNVSMFDVMEKYYSTYDDTKITEIFSKYRDWMRSHTTTTLNTLNNKTKKVDPGISVYKQIKSNVLQDVINAIKENKTRAQIINIIKRYHTKVSISSLETYYADYVKYIRDNHLVADEFFPIKNGKSIHKKPKKERKHYKPKNVDCVGFSKTYQIWVRTEWYQKVKRAVNKYDLVGTVAAIAKETGLKEGHIRATLDYMRNKGKKEVYKTINDKGQVVYQPA